MKERKDITGIIDHLPHGKDLSGTRVEISSSMYNIFSSSLERFKTTPEEISSSKMKDEKMKKGTSYVLPNFMMAHGTVYDYRNQTATDIVPWRRVLLDSGALHASYINKDVALVLKDRIDGKAIKSLSRCVVTYGSTGRKENVDLALRLTLRLKPRSDIQGDKGGTVTAWFKVVNIDAEFIIGLPDLAEQIPELFIRRFVASSKIVARAPDQLCTIDEESDEEEETWNIIPRGTELDPWQFQYEQAPEELEGHPNYIGERVNAMSAATIEEKTLEYMKDIEEIALDIPSYRLGPLYDNDKDFKEYLKKEAIHTFTVQPEDGWGLIMKPLHINFSKEMPVERRLKCRPIAYHRRAHVYKELERMLEYMYVPSDSPMISAMVDADKDSPPWVRLCGDYIFVNKHMETQHAWLPDVRSKLEEFAGYSYYTELDMTNSFHQFPLDLESSRKLTILTPRGPLRPLFMPEGIKPATAILHNFVTTLFKDFGSWMIVMFDNFVVAANTKEELTERTKLVIAKCRSVNLRLKFKKSRFGCTSLKFFGYEVDGKGYTLSKDKFEALDAIQFPEAVQRKDNVELMQSFLGTVNFHRPLYVNARKQDGNDHAHIATMWVDLVSPLYEMTTNKFNWDSTTWKKDYRQLFINIKEALKNAGRLYHPNYSLPWVLQTDASQLGIGGVLFQLEKEERFPIATVAQKFTEHAMNWPTIKQEGYAVYKCVEKLEHLLKGKEFKVETDHANLEFMEKAASAILRRWCLYLQEHLLQKIVHVPGNRNAADHPSRSFPKMEVLTNVGQDIENVRTLIAAVHGGARLHFSKEKTMQRLRDTFPEMKVPEAAVADFIEKCDTCQKMNLGNSRYLTKPAELKNLMQDDPRSQIGIDMLELPETKDQYRYLHVIVNHFTKFVYLYKAKSADAVTAANAVLLYMAMFGPVQHIISDPGSNYTSKVMQEVNRYMGLQRKVSLVDRHESNGVEPFNKQIIRHLSGIIYDAKYEKEWDDDALIACLMDNLNNLPRVQTGGYTSMELVYGLPLPQGMVYGLGKSKNDENTEYTEYMSKLRTYKEVIQRASDAFIAKETEKINQKNNNKDLTDKFCKGEWVLIRQKNHEKGKLDLPWKGPYVVISHIGNDVSLYDEVQQKEVNKEHVDNVKSYLGSTEQALDAARSSAKESEIKEILYHEGDPNKRNSMSFVLRYKDGSISPPLVYGLVKYTAALEQYAKDNKDLLPLRYESAAEWQKNQQTYKYNMKQKYYKGQKIYMDIRCRDCIPADYYIRKDIPNKATTLYLAEAQVNLVDMRAIYIKYVDEYLYKNMNSKVSMLAALMYVYTEEEIQNKTYQIYTHNQA